MAATQSSTYKSHHAALCIDGDTGPVDGLGMWDFCHTKNERYPWFAADYGIAYAIERVEIVNRHNCRSCAKWTRNVEVRVSDDLPTSASRKFSGGSLLGTFAGPGTKGQHITISGGDKI